MATPKMTLKVELIGNNGAVIKLVQVTDIYSKSGLMLNVGHNVYTDNDWMFFIGQNFSVNKRTKVFIVPKNPHKHEDTIYFNDDDERRKVLKDIHTALIHWSGSYVFNNKSVFNNQTPKIKYHKNIWIIF